MLSVRLAGRTYGVLLSLPMGGFYHGVFPCSGDHVMSDEKTAELEAENQAQTETGETTDAQTDEGGDAADVDKPAEGGDSAEEENPYKAELDDIQRRNAELEDALKKKEEIIEHKNRAIESTKKKSKDFDVDSLKESIKSELRSELLEQEIQKKINVISSDRSERDLIQHHYQNSIRKTGNVEEDLMNAVALANRKTVWNERITRASEERNEEFLTSVRPSDARGATKSIITDPVLREAAKLVRAVKPEAVKHLKR